MQIDWITVAAQVVNFLVLVWLLRRFLYGPITRAMKRREERIEGRLDDAEKKRKEAEEEAEDYRQKQRDLDEKHDQIVEAAREEAEELRERLEKEAREEVEKAREAWRRELADEKDSFLSDLRQKAALHVANVARTALSAIADADLEAQAAEKFIAKLRDLDKEEIESLRKAAKEAEDPISIESAFDLAGPIKGKLTKAVRETIADDLEVDYTHADDLTLGIRFRVGPRAVEWSLDAYLDRLEETTAQILSEASVEEARDAA